MKEHARSVSIGLRIKMNAGTGVWPDSLAWTDTCTTRICREGGREGGRVEERRAGGREGEKEGGQPVESHARCKRLPIRQISAGNTPELQLWRP